MDSNAESLYARTTAELEARGHEFGITRLVYAAVFADEAAAAEALLAHRKVVEDVVEQHNCHVTGLAIHQGNTLCHLLEAPCAHMLQVLTALHKDTKPVRDRVLDDSEDCPSRYYREWFSCTISEKAGGDIVCDESTANELVLNLSKGLFRVGEGLANETDTEVEFSKYGSNLPAADLLRAICACDLFFSLQEYIEVFCEPLDVVLDSELTWPIVPLVKY